MAPVSYEVIREKLKLPKSSYPSKCCSNWDNGILELGILMLVMPSHWILNLLQLTRFFFLNSMSGYLSGTKEVLENFSRTSLDRKRAAINIKGNARFAI